MSPVSVVTDSTSYLPPELVERDGIEVVPLYVVFGGDRTVPEVEITDYPAFFEELRSAEKLPTTSQPSVGDFLSVYEPLIERGDDILSIHLSGGISGTRYTGAATGSEMCAQSFARSLSRGKGTWPVRHSKSTQPSE